MIVPLFAMPPRMMLAEWSLGLLIDLVLAILVVRGAMARSRPDRPRRRLGLVLLALLGGPATGLALAPLAVKLGEVSPLDVGYTYAVFIAVGCFAGLLAGAVQGLPA